MELSQLRNYRNGAQSIQKAVHSTSSAIPVVASRLSYDFIPILRFEATATAVQPPYLRSQQCITGASREEQTAAQEDKSSHTFAEKEVERVRTDE